MSISNVFVKLLPRNQNLKQVPGIRVSKSLYFLKMLLIKLYLGNNYFKIFDIVGGFDDTHWAH